jgi:hypothetical protein
MRLGLASMMLAVIAVAACGDRRAHTPAVASAPEPTPELPTKVENPGRVVHALVALCDNENQGIVPVPAHLGNGEDPDGNLYWGAAFGVRTHFSKSKRWQKLGEYENPSPNVLQRVVFKHVEHNVYLVADAYRGSRIRQTIGDFFLAASGSRFENVEVGGVTIQVLGGADVITFIGHNGLMDFKIGSVPAKKDDHEREAVILACASRNYFKNGLRQTGATPLLWTTNLMAPEAYILHDALEAWIADETNEVVRFRAAAAYSKYQRISQKAAESLLVTGW